MIEIRKALVSFLKTLHPRIYFQNAPKDAIFPYVVYDIPSIFSNGEGGEKVVLDLDFWDSNLDNNSLDIENLAKIINLGLDKKTLVTEEIIITFFLENKMALLDDNKDIRRRKYVYTGMLINII